VKYSEVNIINEFLFYVHPLHVVVHPIGADHFIGHLNSEGLHRVALVVLEATDIFIVEVADYWLPHPAERVRVHLIFNNYIY
jgi:hypothetical protein